jgi:glutathione synthase/RimK-type ligase-like ATP-grasp enzyme
MTLKASKTLGICFGRLDIMDSLQGPQAIEFNVFPGRQIVDITGVKIHQLYIDHALENYEQARENTPEPN